MEQTPRDLEARRRKLIHQAKLIAERYLRREHEHITKSSERIKHIELDMNQTRHRIGVLKDDIDSIFGEIDEITRKLED